MLYESEENIRTLFLIPSFWILKTENQIDFGFAWLKYRHVFYSKAIKLNQIRNQKNEEEMLKSAISAVMVICKNHGKQPKNIQGIRLFLEQNPGLLQELNHEKTIHPYVVREVLSHYLLSFT